jgi:aminoglycoside/choline kinase family phosphotransferase
MRDQEERKENTNKKSNSFKKKFTQKQIVVRKRQKQERIIPSTRKYMMEELNIFLEFFCPKRHVEELKFSREDQNA